MYPKFLNRADELAFLGRKWREKGKQLVVIYGRRRVGKTELITFFAKDKPHIYFLASKRGTLANAELFAEKAAAYFGDIRPAVKDFDDVFRYLVSRSRGKLIVIIDEFSYLVEKDPAIPSVFQKIVDEILTDDMLLILCGSSISMMERGALSYKSPLYGRRTGQWKLTPFRIRDVIKFFPDTDLASIVEFYSIVGDIPAYLALIKATASPTENIKTMILTKGGFLYDEGRQLLMQELREPDTYFSILWAMTKASKPTEIANLAGLPAKDLPKYVKNLLAIDLIEKTTIITERRPKKNLYFIKDRFLEFWFKFVFPNRTELEEKRADYVLKGIKENFAAHVGRAFEHFCLNLLKEGVVRLFEFDKIGRHWGKTAKGTYEIDILALNKRTGNILFGECKWRERVDAAKVLRELKEKAGFVDWQGGKRREHYVIFSKSFKRKVKEENVYCFDLKDIKKALA